MRVLTLGSMYPPHHQGGYELVWSGCVESLRAAGNEVFVLTTDHKEPGIPVEPSEAGVERSLRWYWRDHDFPDLSPPRRAAIERHNARVLRRTLRTTQPEAVVFFAMGGMSLSLLERVRRAGLPALAVVCDDWISYGPHVDAWTRLFWTRPRAARLFERLGFVTSVDLADVADYRFLSDVVRRRAERVAPGTGTGAVVHQRPDLSLFRPAESRPWRRQLLYSGRIDPRKGIGTIIEALAELPAYRLVVDGAGDGKHLAELRGRAAELSISDRVSFQRSERSALPGVYAASDVLVFPVEWDEPWGLVPLEAMAVRRPVVATGCGGSGEYLNDAVNCLLFEPGDPRALAQAVRRLEGDDGLRDRLIEGGSATIESLRHSGFEEAVAEWLAAPR